jgi:hypothetical protein
MRTRPRHLSRRALLFTGVLVLIAVVIVLSRLLPSSEPVSPAVTQPEAPVETPMPAAS